MALRVLLTGLGSIGQRHARNLRELLGADVDLLAYRVKRTVPLIDSSMQAGAGDPEEEYGIRSFDDLDEALAERPDAALITNPANLHVPTALAAARAGCHLLIEKPLSDRLDGVEELSRIVDERKLVALVGYQLRFHPGYLLLREAVADGRLGTLLGARFCYGEYMPAWHPWEDYRESNAARPDQGGGVVLAQIHDLDIAIGLFGRPQRVYAIGGSRSSLGLEVEDVASILLDVGGMPVHLHQDVVERPPRRLYEVIGEDARICWDYYANTVTLTPADGSDVTHTFDGFERNELFLDEMRHFLACIDGRQRSLVDVRAGAVSLEVALAVRRSLATGEAVGLPWTDA